MQQYRLTHYKALSKLGLPIIIGQLGTIILGFADTLMIGRYGTEELAAASFVNNMFMLILIFSIGYSYGMTPLVGAAHGKGEDKKIGILLQNGLIANGLLGLLLVAIMTALYIFLPYLGQPEQLLPLIRPYFIVNLISLPFSLAFNVFKQTADGTMRTKTGMWIMLGGNLTNIIGNYILIYGHFGLPELGLLGAGISTMCSRILMTIVFLWMFAYTKSYNPYRHALTTRLARLSTIRNIHSLALPMALQIGMETAAFSLTSIIVGWIGVAALAANQIILICSQFCYNISSGMATAVSIRASYFFGQKDYQALNSSITAGLQLVLLLNLCTSVLLYLLRFEIGTWFTTNPEVIHLVAISMLPLMVYQFGDGLQCTYANALRGMGRVQTLVPVAFVSYFIICIPLSYLLSISFRIGLPGIWWSYPFGLTTAGILFYLFYRKYHKTLMAAP